MTFSAAADFAVGRPSAPWSYVFKADRAGDRPFEPIETFVPALRLTTAGQPLLAEPGPNPPAWQVEGDTPWVAANTSGVDQRLQEWGRTIVWPAGALVVHPGDNGIVAVRWHSPVDGCVDVACSFAHAYPEGGGDGIAWSVVLSEGGRTLASGEIRPGDPPSGELRLSGAEVVAGQGTDFVVDSQGDHTCDWTRVEAGIRTTPS